MSHKLILVPTHMNDKFHARESLKNAPFVSVCLIFCAITLSRVPHQRNDRSRPSTEYNECYLVEVHRAISGIKIIMWTVISFVSRRAMKNDNFQTEGFHITHAHVSDRICCTVYFTPVYSSPYTATISLSCRISSGGLEKANNYWNTDFS